MYNDPSLFYLDSTFKRIQVFKKCDFSVNQYYWNSKSKDSSFFYTKSDNDEETLKSILKSTRISEFRHLIVDHFFEYCLISYLVKESTDKLDKLSSGEEVDLSGVRIRTKDWFARENRNKGDPTLTPDVWLKYDDREWIIDAYNGSNKKEIIQKLKDYKKEFPHAEIFVFSSGCAQLEQLSVQNQQNPFKFWTLSSKNEPKEGVDPQDEPDCNLADLPQPLDELIAEPQLVAVDIIPIVSEDRFTIKASDLNSKYFEEYRIFWTENFYWQNCEQKKKIIQTHPNNKR